MRKNNSIVLMIVLYLLIFASAFCLITYFNGMELLQPFILQLVIGSGLLLIAIIVLIISSKKKEKKEEQQEEQACKMKQTSLNLDQQIIEEETQEAQQLTLNQHDSNELQKSQEEYLSTDQLRLIQQQPQRNLAIEFKIEDTATLTSQAIHLNEDKNGVETSDSKQAEKMILKETEPAAEEKAPINPDLSETQILYIQNSDNSYINELGQPQLMITQAIGPNDLKRAISKVQQPVQQQTEPHQSDDEMDCLLEEEKNEKLHGFLDRTIIVLFLTVAIIGIYFALSVFMG